MRNSSWNSRTSYYKPTAYSSNSPTLNPQFKSIYTIIIIIIIINIIFTSPTFLFCSYLALFGLVSCSDILKHQQLHPHAGSGMRSQPGSFILVLFFFFFLLLPYQPADFFLVLFVLFVLFFALVFPLNPVSACFRSLRSSGMRAHRKLRFCRSTPFQNKERTCNMKHGLPDPASSCFKLILLR